MKILVFTSNIGSYLQIYPLLKKYNNKFSKITFLLSGNCTNLIPDLKKVQIISKPVFSKSELISLFKKKSFDSSYIGMTALHNTNENYLCSLCRKYGIKTWSIQDYPQYYGSFDRENYPDNIFVLDSESYIDCKKKYPLINVFKILSPKHILYEVTQDLFKAIKLKSVLQSPLCTIAFQPFLPGVEYNLIKFINFLEKGKIKFEICLHPDQFNDHYLIKELEKLKYMQNLNRTIEENIISFFSCKNLVTCFSTVAIDLDFGLGQLKAKCKKIHYLFEGDIIKSTFRDASSNLKLPYQTINIPSQIYNDIFNCYEEISNESYNKLITGDSNKFPENIHDLENELDLQLNRFFDLIG